MFRQCIAGLITTGMFAGGQAGAAADSGFYIGSQWSLRLEYETVEVSDGAFNVVTLSGGVRF